MKGNTTVLVDGSFFPDNSSLVSAHCIITNEERKLGCGDFASKLAVNYRNSFAAISRGVLAICKLIELATQRRTSDQIIRVKIVSDCAAVIKFLHCTRSTILNKATLLQVKREILLIKEQVNLKLTPVKVAAHRDELIPFKKLTFLEKFNTICDRKAKYLIQSETREDVTFLFESPSPYILIDNKVMSQSQEIE